MKITIEDIEGQWLVGMQEGKSIWPTTSYITKRLAISRVMQLLDVGPVAPQTHPERVCIGEGIDFDNGD